MNVFKPKAPEWLQTLIKELPEDKWCFGRHHRVCSGTLGRYIFTETLCSDCLSGVLIRPGGQIWLDMSGDVRKYRSTRFSRNLYRQYLVHAEERQMAFTEKILGTLLQKTKEQHDKET